MRARALVFVTCLALAACGGSSDEPPRASPTASTTPAPEDPTLTAKPPGGSKTVTGIVETGVEAGCVVLTVAGGQSYVLTGTVAGLTSGDRVTVKGRTDPDAASTCQQGPVLEVTEVRPG